LRGARLLGGRFLCLRGWGAGAEKRGQKEAPAREMAFVHVYPVDDRLTQRLAATREMCLSMRQYYRRTV
jgi:hypothetical protein